MYRTLKLGDAGLAVAMWQQFLIDKQLMSPLSEGDLFGQGDDHEIGIFNKRTEEATKRYQKSKSLTEDGVIGDETYAQASAEGFNGIEVEQALVLGFNRVSRTLVPPFELVIDRREISFKSGNATQSVKQALERFRIMDDVG